ncbi:hypothetical protein [Robinsoniella sp. KNHs210]|uniref:hypothetical protein n=1 Tax=Robinsoniella sp. KNHs210 TaxID=1469950 RepID=UPI0012DCC99E|nr:hypothetical protein [Robinsoniella sp. KNHs210]
MTADTSYSVKEMSEEDYRRYIKIMVNKITDISNLRQLYVITHRKFIGGKA